MKSQKVDKNQSRGGESVNKIKQRIAAEDKKRCKDGQKRTNKWRIKRKVKLRRADEEKQRLKTKKAETEKEDKKLGAEKQKKY